MAEALSLSGDKFWMENGALGAAGSLPSSRGISIPFWLGSGVQQRSIPPEWGVREGRGYRSPEKLGPHLYLGTQLLHCQVRLLEQAACVSWCSDSRAPGPEFPPLVPRQLHWLPAPDLFIPGCWKVSWPCLCLKVLGFRGDSDLSLDSG